MSVCDCPWGSEDIVWCKARGPHTARKVATTKAGVVKMCPNCNVAVQPGERCIDYVGVREGGGWFSRFHVECWELMEEFADRMCGGIWAYPFDLKEAAEHAAAEGDDPFWRSWLLKYERTWAWTPDPQ